MTYPKQPGTYCFYNTVNNKVYVGSAQCLYTRLNNHFNGRAKDSNLLLRRSIKKRGLKAYDISYVITETHTEALMQEQLILDYLFQNDIPKYNLSSNAYGGDGFNAKVRYALEVSSPNNIYTFKSGIEAAKNTTVPQSCISTSCKNAKPYNSKSERWLFSDISIDDLKVKFNNLKQAEIKGNNSYFKGFILINEITKEQTQIFYKIKEPQKYGYKIPYGNLGQCLLGKRKTVNGYYVALCI